MRELMKSATSKQTIYINEVLRIGLDYINKMPLDKYPDDFWTNMEEVSGTDFNAVPFPETVRKQFSININLFNYLILLARVCESNELTQKRKLKSLQNILFMILADDKYYNQAIKVLRAYIMPDGTCSLTDVDRADFFGVLYLLENQRNEFDLPNNEIVVLYNAMDPNHGNISVIDVLSTDDGDISSIEAALLREEKNISSCKDD